MRPLPVPRPQLLAYDPAAGGSASESVAVAAAVPVLGGEAEERSSVVGQG